MDFMQISMLKESVVKHLLNLDPPTIQTRMLLRSQRGLLKKNLNSPKKEQPGQKSQEKVSQEDLTQKDADLMKRKIQDLTLKHQARRLEIPGGHPSALE